MSCRTRSSATQSGLADRYSRRRWVRLDCDSELTNAARVLRVLPHQGGLRRGGTVDCTSLRCLWLRDQLSWWRRSNVMNDDCCCSVLSRAVPPCLARTLSGARYQIPKDQDQEGRTPFSSLPDPMNFVPASSGRGEGRGSGTRPAAPNVRRRGPAPGRPAWGHLDSHPSADPHGRDRRDGGAELELDEGGTCSRCVPQIRRGPADRVPCSILALDRPVRLGLARGPQSSCRASLLATVHSLHPGAQFSRIPEKL